MDAWEPMWCFCSFSSSSSACLIISAQCVDVGQYGEQAVGIPRDVLSDLPPDLRVLVLAENGVDLPPDVAFETGFMIPASSASAGPVQPPTLPEAMEVSTAEEDNTGASPGGAAAEPMSLQQTAGEAGPSTSAGMLLMLHPAVVCLTSAWERVREACGNLCLFLPHVDLGAGD